MVKTKRSKELKMRLKRFLSKNLIIVSLVFVFCGNAAFAESVGQATSPLTIADSLRQAIDQKAVELQKLQVERDNLEKGLSQVGALKTSLNKEIKTIDYNINQLNFSIQANKLTLQKLGLEIESLGNDVHGIERDIDMKRVAIRELLVRLQQRDRENFLVTFLRNASLAQSVTEIQNIVLIQSNLSSVAVQLREFQTQLVKKLSENEQKKKQQEREKATLVNRQYIVLDQKSEKEKVLGQTKAQERLYTQQINELDKKQEEISSIIEEFERQLRASFDPSLLPIKRAGVLGFPVDNTAITQCYGATPFAARAYGTKFHTGVDFGVPVGTPLFAVLDGKVVASDNNDKGTSRFNKFQYGKYVVIEHDNNLSTLYAHLSRYAVQKGDIVKKGDVIGYSGNTGYAYGPHLHFGVYWAPSILYKSISPASGLVPVGVTIDPMGYLPNNAKSLASDCD